MQKMARYDSLILNQFFVASLHALPIRKDQVLAAMF